MALKTPVILAATLALSSFAGSSLAAKESGAYIGGGIGSTAYNDDDKLDSYDLDDNSVGWTVFAGYRFFRFLAIEGGYTNFGEFSSKRLANTTDESFEALYLAGVGILPLGEAWQLHAKLGGGSLKLDQKFSNQSGSDSDGGTWMIGVGGQWAPVSLNGLAFNLNLESYSYTVEQLDDDYNQSLAMLSLSVQYTF